MKDEKRTFENIPESLRKDTERLIKELEPLFQTFKRPEVYQKKSENTEEVSTIDFYTNKGHDISLVQIKDKYN